MNKHYALILQTATDIAKDDYDHRRILADWMDPWEDKPKEFRDTYIANYMHTAKLVVQKLAEKFECGYMLCYEKDNPETEWVSTIKYDFKNETEIIQTPREYMDELLREHGLLK